MEIRKNDQVKVIAGKEKGKAGRVLEVLREKDRVRVEKLMIYKRHYKRGRNPRYPEGGIHELEGTIALSNVMLLCPRCNEPTRVGHTVIKAGEAEKKVRACRRCGKAIDDK
jgi:large subunit ribosomal protein L24